MKDVGKNILELRKKLGWTQEELARRVGYSSKSTINKIEMGSRDLPQRKIKLFADALGVTPGVLMGWEWEEEPEELAEITAQVLQDPDLLQMVKQYLGLSEGDRYVARVTVASLATKKTGAGTAPAGQEEKEKTDAVDVSPLFEFE